MFCHSIFFIISQKAGFCKSYALFLCKIVSLIQSAVLCRASSMACAYVSSVVDTSECPSIPATVSTSTPFESKTEAAECRNKCGLIWGRPCRSQNAVNSRFTFPGFIGFPFHLGNTRLLSSQRSPSRRRSFACSVHSLRKRSIVSSGRATRRLLSVFVGPLCMPVSGR